jgi:hypothetical protein
VQFAARGVAIAGAAGLTVATKTAAAKPVATTANFGMLFFFSV